jgi:hypothetical protein
MLTALVITLALSPCLAVLGLLALASRRERVHDQVLGRQAILTDAIHRELGAIVSPVVTKGITGPWRIRMAVPLAQPAAVATLLAIVSRELAATPVATREDYQLVLTKQPEAARTRAVALHRSPARADIVATARWLAPLERGLINGRQ